MTMELMQLNGGVEIWLTVLGETTLRVSLVLLLAAAVVLFLKSSTATLRHFVWAVALGGALMLPVAAGLLPAVQVPLPFFDVAPAGSAGNRMPRATLSGSNLPTS